MPYCLYVRKSRADAEAEARGEGETLTRHINALLELAKRRQLNVTKIYREIVSGDTIAARPIAQQLLNEVGQGMWDGVLVMEVERLARGDTIDQGIVAQTFKFSGTRIITPIKDYDPNDEFDEEYFEFGLFMSRREYKTINRRLQRGRLASVKEGKWLGSCAPYGYERVKLANDKGCTLAPYPPEAEIVTMIFSLYTQGEQQNDGTFRRLGVSLIVRKLNELRIRPRVSEHWSPATIRDILINPVYIGKIRWNWRHGVKKMVDGQVREFRPRAPIEDCILVDGLHPAIVDNETFALAQEYMANNPRQPVPARQKVMNPLAGLVICAKCGRRMTRRPYGGRQPETLMCKDTACDNISSALHLVEARILDALRNWLAEYKLQLGEDSSAANNKVVAAANEKALQQLTAEHATLCKQLDNIYDLLEQGIYTTDQFLDRSRKLSERISQNEHDAAVLNKSLAADKMREISRRQLIPKVEHVLEVYSSLPSAKAKNDMLKEVLEKVVYIKTSDVRKGGSPDNFQITIYPKLPKTD